MRILTAANHLDAQGGLERVQLQACRELQARGHQIDLLYTEPGDLLPEWDLIVDRRVRVRDYGVSRNRPFSTGAAVLGTVAAVRRLAPDLVYIHHHLHALSVGRRDRPLVCHLHMALPVRPPRQHMPGLRRVHTFIAVSRFTAELWSTYLDRDIDDFTIVPNAVDVEQFRPLDDSARRKVREAAGLPLDRFLVLYAGRVVPEKAVDCALEAVRRLPSSRYHLAIAGEPQAAYFQGGTPEAEAYGAGLRSRYDDVGATWLGRRNDVPRLVSAADVVVLPSRSEQSGLIVLEALAGGTPVVASAVGGIVEMLTGPLAANLVPPDDPRVLAERIRSLHDWRTETPELGLRGRRHVERNYAVDAMGDRLNETIVRVAAKRASARL